MSQRILVIDDSATIHKVIRIAFAAYDVKVDSAASYREAVHSIRSSQPDVILADASLSGTQTPMDFKRLVDEADGAPMILLYGSYDHVDEGSFREVGFSTFVRKPFDSQEIVAQVKRAVGGELKRKIGIKQEAPVEPLPPLARKPASETQPHPQPMVADGLLGGFAPSRPKNMETTAPSPAEPMVDLPTSGEASVNVHVMESLLAQTLTDNRRKGEKAFVGKEPPRPGAKATEELPRMDRRPPPAPQSAREPGFEVEDLVDPTPVMPPPVMGYQPPTPQELKEMLQPILREEIGKLVAEAVEDYCERHFGTLAREVITAEIRRLAEEKSRHLVDN